MNQTYLNENKEFIDGIIESMVEGFKNNENSFLPPKPKTQENVAVIQKQNKNLPRYGVRLTQDGENYVFNNILLIRDLLIKKYNIDSFDATKAATDIMAQYMLEKVYVANGYKFLSTYEELLKKKNLYFKIKFFGFFFFVIFFLVVIIAGLIMGL